MDSEKKIVCNPFFSSRAFPDSASITCFVIMPFHVPILEEIYRDSVKPVVEGLGITCIRGDDIFSVSSIMEDVWAAMCKAQFIIGEFTGRNPNVLYEAGIAHTLGKPLICLTQDINDIPFDFRYIRHIVYQNSPRGYRELESRLEKTINTLLGIPLDHVPQPVESPSEELYRLRRALFQERQSTTELYLAIEQRILQKYEAFSAEIQRLKDPGERLITKAYFDEMAFCEVPESEISVDFYSEDDRQIITIAQEQVQSFFISKYPITNTQYNHFAKDTGYPPPENWPGGKPPDGKEDHPVLGVSWVDVTSYCNYLSESAGKTVRLPTEVEWLAAAGYGLQKQRYPWGNEWKMYACNSKEYNFGETTSVHQFEGKGDSPYGCVDMLGNIWEWTTNRYQYADSEGFTWRAVRGGASYSALQNIGSLARLVAFPGHFLFVRDLGFRVVYSD
jgi:Sulfatase-modifying factor enzyme 1